jgi:hypothetical protein
MAVWGSRPQGGRPTTVFFPLGYPFPYGPAWDSPSVNLDQVVVDVLPFELFKCEMGGVFQGARFSRGIHQVKRRFDRLCSIPVLQVASRQTALQGCLKGGREQGRAACGCVAWIPDAERACR